MMTKRKSDPGAKRCVVVLLVLGLYALNTPLLAGQGLEEKVRELTLEVEQLKAMILELRSEISKSKDEPRDAKPEPQEERLTQLEENQQLLQDRIQEQHQTKVESASKYRTKLSGLVMLNIFGNRGRVEHEEDPNLALRPGPTDTGGTVGLSAIQSQVGLETYGPTFGGAKTSGGLQFDFYGFSPGSPYAPYWGDVRLRTATVRLDWPQTSVVVGQDAPFI